MDKQFDDLIIQYIREKKINEILDIDTKPSYQKEFEDIFQ
jgi:hypothetical protein